MSFNFDAKTRYLLEQDTLDDKVGRKNGRMPRKVILLPTNDYRHERLDKMRRQGKLLYWPDDPPEQLLRTGVTRHG